MKKYYFIILLMLVIAIVGCNSKSKNEFYLNEYYTVNVGEYKTISFTNTTDYKDVIWSSNNKSIATVEKGKLFGMNPGVTTITARAGNYIASATVEVKSDFYISASKKTIEMGNITTLTIRTSLEGTVIWTASSDELVTLRPDGLSVVITPNGIGEVTITATLKGKTATSIITIIEAKGD